MCFCVCCLYSVVAALVPLLFACGSAGLASEAAVTAQIQQLTASCGPELAAGIETSFEGVDFDTLRVRTIVLPALLIFVKLR